MGRADRVLVWARMVPQRARRAAAGVRAYARRSIAALVAERFGIARLTLAAVIAYVFADNINPGPDLTGPLTALLVVQTSLVGSLRSGVGRVGAVLTGVVVAIVLSTWFGLSWWSLGAAIGLALAFGYAFRLGDHVLETPISAMLILGVAQHDVAAETRIVNTLIGAAVGMTFNLAFPPTLRAANAQLAVRDLADGAAQALAQAGEDLRDHYTRARLDDWLRDIHAVLPLVGRADLAVTEAAERRRLNPRALTRPDSSPGLRAGIAALDRSVLAVRSTLLAVAAQAPEDSADLGEHEQELRGAFSVLLVDIAECLRAYGSFVVAEANGRAAEANEALATTLEGLRETRALLIELAMVDPHDSREAWLLRGGVLAGVERVIAELEVVPRGVPTPQPTPRSEVVNRLWILAHSWSEAADAAAARGRVERWWVP